MSVTTQGRPHTNLLQIMYYFFRVYILFIRSDLGAAILEGVRKRTGEWFGVQGEIF